MKPLHFTMIISLVILLSYTINAMSPQEKKLIWAVQVENSGDFDTVQSLLQAKTNINVIDQHGSSPLIYAVCRGAYCIVELLVNHKADVNSASRHDGQTPLFFAAHRYNPHMVRLLIQAQANVNHRDRQGCSALDYIMLKRDSNVHRTATVKSLLMAKAKVDSKK